MDEAVEVGYDLTHLDEGQARFQWPYDLSIVSTLELQNVLLLRINAMRRRVGLPKVELTETPNER